MPRLTFAVTLVKREGLKFSKPTGWTMMLGSLGLKMVKNNATITIATMIKKRRDMAKQIFRPLEAIRFLIDDEGWKKNQC